MTSAPALTAPSADLAGHVADTVRLLRGAVREHGRVVYASSLGAEATVLTDLIFRHAPQIDIFTVDTGRLPEATLELLERIERHYGRRIRVVFPEAQRVQNYVADHGVNGFYQGLAQRQACCHIRKVEPFQRAIVGYNAWVTGVRHEQSAERAVTPTHEWDARYRLQKVNPLPALDSRRDLEIYPRGKITLQSAPRCGIPQHRLRALHARGRARPGQSGRPLVVGEPRIARVRAATTTITGFHQRSLGGL